MKIAHQHQLNVQIEQHKKFARQIAKTISAAQPYTKKRPSAPFTELLLDPKRGGLPGALGESKRWNSPTEMKRDAKIAESRDRISKIIDEAQVIIGGRTRGSCSSISRRRSRSPMG